jgi:hypothetical protein
LSEEVVVKESHLIQTCILVLVLLCALTPRLAAQGAADAGTIAAIRALEQEWTVGQSHNDNRALDLIFDNSLVYVEYGKLVSKGEYLSRIRQYLPGLDQIAMGPMNVRLFGTTAIVVGTYTEKQLHSSSTHVKRWRFIDTWVYKKSGWVLVAAGASPVTK